MKDWEIAESIVKRKVSGKRTVGSGNKGQRGDVVTSTHVFEVKQTNKEKITIKKSWFTDIESYAKNKEPGVILVIGLQATAYLVDSSNLESKNLDWKSISRGINDLPELIYTEKNIWKKVSMTDLKEYLYDD